MAFHKGFERNHVHMGRAKDYTNANLKALTLMVKQSNGAVELKKTADGKGIVHVKFIAANKIVTFPWAVMAPFRIKEYLNFEAKNLSGRGYNYKPFE